MHDPPNVRIFLAFQQYIYIYIYIYIYVVIQPAASYLNKTDMGCVDTMEVWDSAVCH